MAEHIITFKQLETGDTFDFISGKVGMDSFFARCVKISPRRYAWTGEHGERFRAHVGTVTVRVYHVVRKDGSVGNG